MDSSTDHIGRDKREYERERKRRWRSANPNRAKRPPGRRTLPFVGVDGEGYTDSEGRHKYNMLRAGGWILECEEQGGRLEPRDCLDFLSGLPDAAIYVAYFFDYDVTKILEGIGWYKLTRLLNRDSRVGNNGRVLPVDLLKGEYQVDYMPRKYFKVRKRTGERINDDGQTVPAYAKWVTINDVGPFFQCRFVQTLEQWKIGSEDQRRAIAQGKALRNEFTLAEYAEIKAYNALECELLADLMEQFRDACLDVGYVPRQWQGPGQIAEAMLHQNGIPKTKDVALFSDPRNKKLLQYAQRAFYGGRPEISAVGRIPHHVIQWDINSAYPYALEHVPCLEHGKWNHVKVPKAKRIRVLAGSERGLGIEPTALYYGSFDWNGKGYPPVLYGLPIRSDTGTISYPKAGRGWYWGFEILASVHQVFNAVEGFEYVENCRCVPFGWVRKIYAVRKSMGKDARGIVLKLALNSLYGKMAQSIGSPKYANPIWASFITAFCRTQIQNLLHSCHEIGETKCGRGIWMIATDAIFTSYDLPVKEGDGLGQFSKENHPNGIFLVQPGLYFRGNGGKPKTRGVPQALVIAHEQEFRENYRRMSEAGNMAVGNVQMSLRSFVGIRQALHRHSLSILGQWVETTKTISFDWTNKRQPGFAHHSPDDDYITTGPRDGSREIETVPYNKDIGRMLEIQKIDTMDQPDWATQFTSMEEM